MTVDTFCGSYRPGDVEFLLSRIQVEPIVDLHDKEQLIQSGARHYSEMLSPEDAPAPEYLQLFRRAVAGQRQRVAVDLLRLAVRIRARQPSPVLVSLARAGTPVAVALRRLMAQRWGIDAPHYAISIIRGRGIDQAALRHICARHPAQSLVFVDGWTGKGAINAELQRSVAAYNATHATEVDAGLFVLADLAGCGAGSGSSDDYLIPSAILNATVSGLVSRTVLERLHAEDRFHGCVFYEHLRGADMSQWFVDQVVEAATVLDDPSPAVPADDEARRVFAGMRCASALALLRTRFAVADDHNIKLGIGESTRAMLRRSPDMLCVADRGDPHVDHLLWLARTRGVPVRQMAELELKSAVVIKELRHA